MSRHVVPAVYLWDRPDRLLLLSDMILSKELCVSHRLLFI